MDDTRDVTRLALCQIAVTDDAKTNLERSLEAVARAAENGAGVAVLPEATLTQFGPHLPATAEPLDGPFVTGLAEAARRHGLAIVAGVFEPAEDSRAYNTLVVLDAQGSLVTRYRKIHLFDAFGAMESDLVAPGDTLVTVTLDGINFGLLTCYDIRFPELARSLIGRGAEALIIPAAWGTGAFKEEHWATLVRARAIENTVWVAAVDQAPSGHFGVGRSMLVDPLGVVRADLGPYPQVEVREIDPDVTARVRETLPALRHRRGDIEW